MTQVDRKGRIAACLWAALLLCSPYLPALLLQGICTTILFVVLGLLSLFVSVFKEEFKAVLALCLRAIAFQWNVMPFAPAWRALSFARVRTPESPHLSPLFQRPPPLFV